MPDYSSFFFIHIPKCGGTSFRAFLNASALESGVDSKQIYIPGFNKLKNERNYNQLNRVQKYFFNKRHYKVVGMHADLRTYRNVFKSENPFLYTILRDPVDRFISHYNHFYFREGADNCKGVHLNDLSDHKRSKLITQLSNLHIKYLASVDLNGKATENDLDIAKEELLRFSCFGILEKVGHSISILKKNSPTWFDFAGDIPLKNSGVLSVKLNPIREDIVGEIRNRNFLDLDFYKFALNEFDGL